MPTIKANNDDTFTVQVSGLIDHGNQATFTLEGDVSFYTAIRPSSGQFTFEPPYKGFGRITVTGNPDLDSATGNVTVQAVALPDLPPDMDIGLGPSVQ